MIFGAVLFLCQLVVSQAVPRRSLGNRTALRRLCWDRGVNFVFPPCTVLQSHPRRLCSVKHTYMISYCISWRHLRSAESSFFPFNLAVETQPPRMKAKTFLHRLISSESEYLLLLQMSKEENNLSKPLETTWIPRKTSQYLSVGICITALLSPSTKTTITYTRVSLAAAMVSPSKPRITQ